MEAIEKHSRQHNVLLNGLAHDCNIQLYNVEEDKRQLNEETYERCIKIINCP